MTFAATATDAIVSNNTWVNSIYETIAHWMMNELCFNIMPYIENCRILTCNKEKKFLNMGQSRPLIRSFSSFS